MPSSPSNALIVLLETTLAHAGHAQQVRAYAQDLRANSNQIGAD